mgnify:FL=1
MKIKKLPNYGRKELFKIIKLYLLFGVLACYERNDFCNEPSYPFFNFDF